MSSATVSFTAARRRRRALRVAEALCEHGPDDVAERRVRAKSIRGRRCGGEPH